MYLSPQRIPLAFPSATRNDHASHSNTTLIIQVAQYRAMPFSMVIPISSSANAGWTAKRRRAAARCVYPAQRHQANDRVAQGCLHLGLISWPIANFTGRGQEAGPIDPA